MWVRALNVEPGKEGPPVLTFTHTDVLTGAAGRSGHYRHRLWGRPVGGERVTVVLVFQVHVEPLQHALFCVLIGQVWLNLESTEKNFKGNQKVVKWVKIFKTEKALDIEQAMPTEACGEVYSGKKLLKVGSNTIVIVQTTKTAVCL